MPSIIEFDKQSSFQSSSNIGKVIFGIDLNKNLTVTDSNGITTIISSTLPYLEYLSMISRIGLGLPKTNYLVNNTLNINPVWSRISSSNFKFKFDRDIDIDKTISTLPFKFNGNAFQYNITNELNSTNIFMDGFNSSVNSIVEQTDGKILIGGNFTSYNGTGSNYIIRLNSDGSIDTTFVIHSGFDNAVNLITVQTDDKILVGGQFTDYDGTSSNYITRLNTDGSIDNTFVIGTGFDGSVNSIIVQPDGKILVGGQFTDYDGTSSNYITRLNTDGSIDATFVIGTGFDGIISSIDIQSDGKILVGGNFGSYDGTLSNYIIRLNTNGGIDNTFVIGTGFDAQVKTIAVQSNDKILVGGQFTDYDGTVSNYITRLNTDGSIDNTFVIGSGFSSQVLAIKIQSDGKILVGGDFSSYDGAGSNYIVRINVDGSIDSTFVVVSGFNASVYTLLPQSDGNILVGGVFNIYNDAASNYIIKITSTGGYGFIGGFNGPVDSIAIQTDGKILVGGQFGSYNGTGSSYIIRLNTDGSIDNTFVIGSGFSNQVLAIKIQSDGKILVGGGFTSYNGTGSSYIIRLNTDGSVDNTFVIGTGFDAPVDSITIQTDGKILVGGSFGSYNATGSSFIIRLNVDGSINDTFGTAFDARVNTIAIQSDGKILAGGQFTSYDGTGSNYIVRINTDGTIDSSFSIESGFDGQVDSIAIQSDGKILVGGGFTSYNGTGSSYIIRLSSDGTMDNTFVIGAGFNNRVKTIVVQTDGKILVGGQFQSYNGTATNYIVRLNVDGSIQHSFDETFLNSEVIPIAIQSDGNILVGGSFSANNVNYLTKFNNEYFYYLFGNDTFEHQPIEIRVYN